MKDSFLIRGEWQDAISALSNEDAGQLLKAIYAYNQDGSVPDDLSPMARLVFLMARSFFDTAAEKYREKCENNRNNGALGGRPKKTDDPGEEEKPNGFQKNRTVSEKTERFSDGEKEKPKKPNGFCENPIEYEYDSDTEYDSVPFLPERGGERACARVTPTHPDKQSNVITDAEGEEFDLDDASRNRYLPGNMNLSYSQTAELKKRYPAQWYEMIVHLSQYMTQQGKTYADHYAVLLDWAKEDGAIEGRKRPPTIPMSEDESRVAQKMAYRRGVVAKWEAERKDVAE